MPKYLIAILVLRTLIVWPLVGLFETFVAKKNSLELFIILVICWMVQELIERALSLWENYIAWNKTTEFFHYKVKEDITKKTINLFQIGLSNRFWLYRRQLLIARLVCSILSAIISMCYVSYLLALGWVLLIGLMIPWFQRIVGSIVKLYDAQRADQIRISEERQSSKSTMENKIAIQKRLTMVDMKEAIGGYMISTSLNIILIVVGIVVYHISPTSIIYIVMLVAGANKSIPSLVEIRLDFLYAHKALKECLDMLEKGGEHEDVGYNLDWE